MPRMDATRSIARLTIAAAMVHGAAASAQDAPVLEPLPMVTLEDRPGHQHYARVSPDGQRIAFSWLRPGDVWQIFVMPADGRTAPVQLTHAASASRGAAWSPDGRRLAFERDGGLWITTVDDANASETRVEGAVSVASFPDWSPDGLSLVYGTGTGTETALATIPVEGGTPRQLTSHRGGEWFPRWSPDGRRIAFYSTWDARMTDIWTVASDGSDLVQITDDAAEDFRPAWSPDGGSLLFTSRRGGKNDLWIAPATPRAHAQRVTDADGIVLHGDWTRDGRVFFGSYPSHPHLFAIDAESGDTTRLTAGSFDHDFPAFSPDGRLLAFTTTRFGAERGIGVMDWTTRDIRPFYTDAGNASSPVWSPDGQRLAFIFNRGGYLDTRQLMVAARNGSKPLQLTHSGDVRDPNWTADAQSIEYASGGTLWRVSASGGEPQRIDARSAMNTDDAGLPNGAYAAQRSPQGRRLWLMPGGDHPTLMVEDARGAAKQLARDLAIASPPTWSADSRHIVVSVDPGEWILAFIADPALRRD